MRTRTCLHRALLAAIAALLILPCLARADSFFMYQGRLKIGGGSPDPGELFDAQFRLFDVPAGGIQITMTVAQVSVLDSNGLFRALLDLGPNAFTSNPRWLELAVRRAGTSNSFAILAPRQRVGPVPSSLHAQRADVATSVTGVISPANLPATVARLDVPQVFTAPPSFNSASGPPFLVGYTQRVANLNSDLLDGRDSTEFWRWETNGGVSSVVGPMDQPIEIRAGNYVNNRLLRLQPGNANLGSSLIGGSVDNSIAAGLPGSVIAGGRGNLIESNADYSVVTGGDANRVGVGARGSTIGGGSRQLIGPNSPYSGVFAGYGQVVSSNSRFAGVLVGGYNTIRETSDFSAIVSGGNHSIGPSAGYSVVLGGSGNKIESGSGAAMLGGGQGNVIGPQSSSSVLGGGANNRIGGGYAVLGGGNANEIGPSAYDAFLGGGQDNKIEFNAHHSANLGGQNNLVRSNAYWATVLGGAHNVAGAPFSVAAGQQAKAEHSGSFVFADMSYADFASMRANEFAVRARGGVRFETGGQGILLDGQRLLPGGGGGGGSNTITAPFTLSDSQPGRSILRGVNESSTLLSAGVCGESSAASGSTIGVLGLNSSAAGTAVYGLASQSSGVKYALRGETQSSEGYAGFFDGRVRIQGGSDAEPLGGGFLHSGADNGANLAIDDNELMARDNGQPSTLYLNNDGGNVILARTGIGRVGIGTGSPTVKLDVEGEIRCMALTLTSSRRFKTDIEPLTNALNRVNALRGVTYRWDEAHGGKADVGFVAEEVELVLPEAVVREPDGRNVAGIKADRVTALAVEAVKELQRVVQAKDAELAELRARLEAIEGRLGLDNTPPRASAGMTQP